MKNILKKIGWALIAAAAAFSALLLILTAAGLKPYVVTSGSMAPAVPAGSLCLVNIKADCAAVKEGDIIAFSLPPAGTVLHRAVEISEEGVVTAGDANRVRDARPVTAGNYIGRAVLTLPFAGRAAAFSASPAGRFILTAGCVFLAGLVILSGGEKAAPASVKGRTENAK